MEGNEIVGFQSLEDVKQTLREPGLVSVRDKDGDRCQKENSHAREISLDDSGGPYEVLVDRVRSFDVVTIVEQVEMCRHRFKDGNKHELANAVFGDESCFDLSEIVTQVARPFVAIRSVGRPGAEGGNVEALLGVHKDEASNIGFAEKIAAILCGQ